MILHLRAAVEQLYAAVPARFTPLRAELVAQAKAAGDKVLAASVGKLRKPTVAAWAVNHFVREHGSELDELRAFAELLREAQRTLDADQLRILGRERARRVDEVGERIAAAAAEAGQSMGPAVVQEVRDTLIALIADEEAEASVLTGALVRSLSYSGFGSVDIDDVVALPDGDDGDGDDDDDDAAEQRPSFEVIEGGGEGGADAAGPDPVDLAERRAARRAQSRARLTAALDAARVELRGADRHVAVLSARHEEVIEGIADLERRLKTARERLEKVGAELDEATSIRDDLEAAEAAAQRAVDAHDDDG